MTTGPGDVAYVKMTGIGSVVINTLTYEAFEGSANPTVLILTEPPLAGVEYTPAHPKLKVKLFGQYGYYNSTETPISGYAVEDDGVNLEDALFVALQAPKGKRASVGITWTTAGT